MFSSSSTQHTMSPRGRIAAGLTLVVGMTTAIALLHALGRNPDFAVRWRDLWTWLETSSPEQVMLAAGRTVALGLAYWVVTTSVIYTFARAARLPRLLRSVEWATPPMIRRMANRAVAVSIAASTLGGSVVGAGVAPALARETPTAVPPVVAVVEGTPASAGSQPYPGTQAGPIDPHPATRPGDSHSGGRNRPRPGYVPSPAGDPGPAVSTANAVLPIPLRLDDRYVPTPAGGDTTHPAPPFAQTTPLRPAPPDHSTEGDRATIGERALRPFHTDRMTPIGGSGVTGTPNREAEAGATATAWTVETGDNLWLIAERHLHDTLGRHPTAPELSTYWADLVTANRTALRSGDPDLIYPGETITCPAVTFNR